MIDPALFSSVPHRNFTALLDFAGTFDLYHRVLANVVAAQGHPYRRYPLGDGRGTPDWLWAVQQTHVNAAAALGIAPPPDLASFDFAHVAQALYRITFDDFCDWYLESIKPRLYEGDGDARATALAALARLLKLLHPVLPHVTEEIWSNLPERETRLIVAAWPEPDPAYDGASAALDRVQDAAAIFRRSGVLVRLDEEEKRIFDAVVKPDRVAANGNAAAEIERLRKEVERAEKMLANERFVENAAPDVVEAEREKLARYRRELDALSG